MFVLMYVNSYEVLGHARLSVMRIYMVVIMGGSMMAIMLGYMFSMYKNIKANGVARTEQEATERAVPDFSP